MRKAVGACAVATLVAALAGGVVASGDPVARIRHAWATFKGGYAANAHTGSRLVSGLGSERYDFYRVALDEFLAHPVLGIGADNFAQQYLRHGRSTETPHYPHSVELRTLSQTGLSGTLLAVVGLGAALLAAGRAIRGPDRLGGVVAAAALAGFAYWAVHGSFDWLWEFAGLGATAFALLGLACSLSWRPEAPARRAHQARSDAARARRARAGWALAGLLVAGLLLIAAAVSLGAPWLSELQVERAARVWPVRPGEAYARLESAAGLNPLSPQPYLLAGGIASRRGELRRAEREFSRALARTPGDAYATLELGAIASQRGAQPRALRLLERAAFLNPRDPLVREALAIVRRGERIDVAALNRQLLRRGSAIE